MSGIDSPEFRKSAYDAAARRAESEELARAQAAQDARNSRAEAARIKNQEAELRAIVDRERAIGRELAKRALQAHVEVNRSWVTAYRPGIGLIRWLQKGTVLAEGWMLLHHDTASETSDGETSIYGSDLVLTTKGRMYVAGIGHSSRVEDLRAMHRHELAHPEPLEYMHDLDSTTAGNTPWQSFTLDDIRLGLAEFAGTNRLV